MNLLNTILKSYHETRVRCQNSVHASISVEHSRDKKQKLGILSISTSIFRQHFVTAIGVENGPCKTWGSPTSQNTYPRNNNLGDLYAESGQTLQGSFSAVSKPNFASKYSLESSRRAFQRVSFPTSKYSLESSRKTRIYLQRSVPIQPKSTKILPKF